MNNYKNILKRLNQKAIENGDIPVSAIIIHNNKIIAKQLHIRKNYPSLICSKILLIESLSN